MGIRGLETFIRKRSHYIYEKIHIPTEIEKWQRAHDKNPIIMIDMKEFIRVLMKFDEGGLILGGRYQPIIDMFEYFFGEIKKIGTNLVFFWRLREKRYDDGSRYMKNDGVFDCIQSHRPLKNYLLNEKQHRRKNDSTLRPCERLWYNLMKIAENYGDTVVDYELDKGAILAYARQHRGDVLALLTRDTDFLVFDDDFEFWSMSDMKIFEFKVGKFGRALKHELGLNSMQMQLLHAIADFEPNEKKRFMRSTDFFDGSVQYVKRQICGSTGYNVSQLTGNLTEAQREQIANDLQELNRTNNCTGSAAEIEDLKNTDTNFKWAMQFCKKKMYFAYKLMIDSMTIQKDLLFIDFRVPNATEYVELVADITLKLCGIVFEVVALEKRPKTRHVATVANGTIEPIEKDIIYPPSFEKDVEQFADSRWTQFQWLTGLNSDFISNVNASSQPNYIRIALFTLKLLKNHITDADADMILLTENKDENRSIVAGTRTFESPPSMPSEHFPDYAELAWVQAAHKYSICFELICHCLEVCGLRKETTLLLFDALKFHGSMYKTRDIQPPADDSSIHLAEQLRNLLMN